MTLTLFYHTQLAKCKILHDALQVVGAKLNEFLCKELNKYWLSNSKRVLWFCVKGETCAALPCHQNPHLALADLACGAACLFVTPAPRHCDSSAFCPLGALVTVDGSC